jgi:hypothetical protein
MREGENMESVKHYSVNKYKFIQLTISIMLIFSFLAFGTPTQVWAQTAESSNPSYDEISSRYGLKPVKSVPIGITPLKFSTPQELESFLVKIKSATSISPHSTFQENNRFNGVSFITTATSYGVVTRSCSVPLGCGVAKFNTWADIRVASSGSFHWIDSVLSTYTGLTGLTMSADLTNAYSYSYNKTSASVSVKGGGIVNIYLIVKGVIKLYSVPVSCSFTYSV